MAETLHTAIIGAGFGGICAAIKLLENGERSFRIYDKASGLGGTWYHNTYPGAACDIQSHLYCYSFEPNPNWSRKYSPQAEIKAYIEHCADKYGVMPHIQLGMEMSRMDFSDGLWTVSFADGSQVIAHHIILANGGLHVPQYPEIAGREDFAGATMHSAAWDHSVDLQGKRIGVIGSAASAIQIIPELAKTASQLTVFQRTPNWIVPRNNRDYTDREKQRFSRWPWLNRLYRKFIFLRQETILFRLVKTSKETRLRRAAQHMATRHIRSTVKDARLQEKLIPDYPMGCKRVLLSDDFYQTLNLEQVDLTTSPIECIENQGIRTADGSLHEFDVIVYATGFDIDGWFDRIHVYGPGGLSLQELWKDIPTAYQGACVPGFPNLWLVTGPNSGLGHNSVVYMIEAQMELIMQGIALAGNDKLISVTEDANTVFNQRIQQDLAKSVWAGSCESWYKRPSGEIVVLYPYRSAVFNREHRHLVQSDFLLEPAA